MLSALRSEIRSELYRQNLLIFHAVQVQEREAIILVIASRVAMTEATVNDDR